MADSQPVKIVAAKLDVDISGVGGGYGESC